MTWWAWMILGAFLFGAELIAIDAQFYLVFLGLSAALVGVASAMGVVMPEAVQWVVFAALSLVSMFTFRKALYEKIHGNVPGFHASLVGESLLLSADLGPGQTTRESFRGSTWTVINSGDASLSGGSRVTVTRNEGLTLYVGGSVPDTAGSQ